MRRLRLVFGAFGCAVARIEIGQRAGQGAQPADGMARHAGQATDQQLGPAGLRGGAMVGVRRRDLAAGRLQVQKGDEDLGAGEAVQGGVMHLGEHPDLAVLQPLDEVDLPQRVVAVQRALEDAGGLVGELADVAGGRQRELPHVVVQVDLTVQPVRVVQPERDLHELPAERLEQMDPLGQRALEVIQRHDAPGGGGRVVDRDAPDVPVVAVVLDGEELGVEAGQLSHGPPGQRRKRAIASWTTVGRSNCGTWPQSSSR